MTVSGDVGGVTPGSGGRDTGRLPRSLLLGDDPPRTGHDGKNSPTTRADVQGFYWYTCFSYHQ